MNNYNSRKNMPYPKIGVSGILFKDNKFLLGKREDDDTQGGLWVTPGGGVEFGETIDIALIREFKEEVLLDIEIVPDFVSIQQRIGRRHVVMPFKQVKSINNNSPQVGEGFTKVDWFTWKEIISMKEFITDMTFNALNEFNKKTNEE